MSLPGAAQVRAGAVDEDPAVYRLHNDRLSVVYVDAATLGDEDPARTLAKAEANWPQVGSKSPASF